MSQHDARSLAMLGRAVRMARREHAWTQRDLEERSGVDQTTISRIERGRVRGTELVRFAWIAWALGDAMPIGGCPHSHRCAYALRRAAALEELAPWTPESSGALDDTEPMLIQHALLDLR
jgi:DNA-binding XRE family transcriptional regulator